MKPDSEFYSPKELIRLFGSVKELANAINKSYSYTYERLNGGRGKTFTVRDKELICAAIEKSNVKSKVSEELLQHDYTVRELVVILESMLKALKGTDEFYYSSLSVLPLNALTAADYAIIPVQTNVLAVQGMVDLLKTVHDVREELNDKLSVAGILFTLAEEASQPKKALLSGWLLKL
ncbi:MAG: ParA family protein [Clostridiales bacterium]|nr:ParA family protein [Clostridiales bacterium]